MSNNTSEPENESKTPDFYPGARFRHRYLAQNNNYDGLSNKLGTVVIQRTQGYKEGDDIYYAVTYDDGTSNTTLPQTQMKKPSFAYRPKKRGGKSKKSLNRKRRTTRKSN
jgi:hypothetical protein